MEVETIWFLICGAIFISMAAASSYLRRIPFSPAIVYLGIGFALGPLGLHLLDLDFHENSGFLERLTEVAVIISLFTAGLKLRAPITDLAWRPAIRLASLGMVITVFLVALTGHTFLGLSIGAAILLGAIMAPTDPVLASDVQTKDPYDGDRLRFTLTAEAGLNDGTAFPFVMLGLGLLGLHEIGSGGWRWFTVDVVWATGAGLGIGAALGTLVAKAILFLRREHKEAVGADEFLALGLIALSYGSAVWVHAYGFLAVFAAGLALRRVEQENTHKTQGSTHEVDEKRRELESLALPAEEAATSSEVAPRYMARAVLQFNESLERIMEVALVVCVGSLLNLPMLAWDTIIFALVLMFVIRPAAVLVALYRAKISNERRPLICWFGIRGIGSLYYLAYAMTHNLGQAEGRLLIDVVLVAVAISVVVHGTTVTPIMSRYVRNRERRKKRAELTTSAELSQ